MGRGKLRIHLGAAPGVGKTYAMLAEAHRRAERGTDCVVAFVETHGRPRTEALLTGLERVPYRTPERGGVTTAEMDLDAVLARRPRVALVDELAHTNAPGSRNAKRWQDVEELLAAGIDVLSTVGIQHLESLGDTVESITGVRERETVPDEVVRRADQVELVDMTPEALRRRMAHGNIHQPDQVDAALSSYFRPGNLAALRELALLWVADRVDAHLQRYRSEHAVSAIWGSRERIVVGLTGGPEGRTLIRRAARLAEKGAGGQLLAVYISRSDGLTSASPGELAAQRTLVEDLGGSFHHVVGDDIPAALLDFARGANATQIVLGSSRRRAWQYVLGPGVGATVARDCGPDLDVHIVTHEEAAKGRGLPVTRGAPLGRLRLAWGWAAGTARPVLLAVLLNAFDPGLAIDMLMFLAVTVAAALLGGLAPALASAAVGSLLLNFLFTPPLHTWTARRPAEHRRHRRVRRGRRVRGVRGRPRRPAHEAARLRPLRYASEMSAAPRLDKPAGRFRRMLDRLSSSQEDLESEELREDAATAGCTRIGDCQYRQIVTVTGTLRTVTLRPRAGRPRPGGRAVRRHRRAGRGVAGQALHRGHRAGAQADRIGPDRHDPWPPGALQSEIRTETPRDGVAGDVAGQADNRRDIRGRHVRGVRPGGDGSCPVRGVRRCPGHGRDGAAGAALRQHLHGQQEPARPSGARRARCGAGHGRGPAGPQGHRARLQRCLRRRLRCRLRDDDRQRQGLLPAGHALHPRPGPGVHRHGAGGRAADRPDAGPGVQGEPLRPTGTRAARRRTPRPAGPGA
ncbi:hypothetical protein SALBM217S_07043 [Streptomyces griseoloalbus]